MDRFLQVVLLAVFTVSTFSYIIPQKSLFEPDMPVELDNFGNSVDDTYPQEYIDKLFSQLTPEDREKLKIDQTLIERLGNPSSQFCSSHNQTTIPYNATDENGEEYYVAQPSELEYKQHFVINACNSRGHSCSENAIQYVGYKGCCQMQEEIIEMRVLSVPIKHFLSNSTPRGEIIKKNMKIKATCVCNNYIMDYNALVTGKDCKSLSSRVKKRTG